MDDEEPSREANALRHMPPDTASADSGELTSPVDGGVSGDTAPLACCSSAELVGFEPPEKVWALRLARSSIVSLVRGVPAVEAASVPAGLASQRGCFVTLFCGGKLRGCIGNVMPVKPLYQAVKENAGAAASRDSRFPSVRPDELDELRIEISVLTEPQELAFNSPEDLLRQLQPGVSGVLLQIGGRLATFLPQVWTQIPDRVTFLNRLAEKAGFPAGAWRGPGVSVSVYRAECFEEPDPRPQG